MYLFLPGVLSRFIYQSANLLSGIIDLVSEYRGRREHDDTRILE